MELIHRQMGAEGDAAVGRWALAVNNGVAKSKKSNKIGKIIAAIEAFGKFGLPTIYVAFNIFFFFIGMAA